MLNRETIDGLSDAERTDLLTWLEDLIKYVKFKQGIQEPSATDPVGDVVIMEHKQQQARAASAKPPKNWMATGYGKEDDKHI